jgi:hypothetical protein
MNQAQFEDKRLDDAWNEIEHVFRLSGMVSPAPGFVNRWQTRLVVEHQKEERRQAGLMIAAILIIAFGFILLIGLQILPNLGPNDSLLNIWVEVISRVIVFYKMIGAAVGTLSRTLPGLIPTSWLVGGLTFMGIVVVLWVSMVRQYIQNQGVTQ